MLARVPASSANLGPGFDAVAVALALYVEVEVVPAARLALSTTGEGAGLFDGPDHLAVRVVRQVTGHDRFAVRVHSQIPLSRGLGSSAALALAAAAAAGSGDPLAVAVAIDGHAENAAASARGGLVAARLSPAGVEVVDLALDPAWRFVVVIPEALLATADARAALPPRVDRADAVANLSGLAFVLAGLGDHRRFLAGAMADRLHQPFRAALFPQAESIMGALRDAGAVDACWSGAGTAMLGLATQDRAAAVAAATTRALARERIAARVEMLDPDRGGLVVR
ncbi:MAG: homoserine kinase [Acidimicrobiales bacterium]